MINWLTCPFELVLQVLPSVTPGKLLKYSNPHIKQTTLQNRAEPTDAESYDLSHQ